MTNVFTHDAFLGGALWLQQPAKGYRIGSDPVLLAALTPVKPGYRVLDLGTGYGQIGLCLLAREPALHITGLELMPAAAALARQNIRRNKFGGAFEVIEGNVQGYPFTPEYQVVVCNPPYRQENSHTPSPDPIKAAATVEQVGQEQWVKAAACALVPGGHLMLIQDSRRETELIIALRAHGFGRIAVLPLHGKVKHDPLRIVLRAERGGIFSVNRLPGLVLHEDSGAWRTEVNEVLRAPGELALWPF